MWEWLNDNIQRIVRNVKFDSRIGDRQDVAQETLMYLLNEPAIAKKIYENQENIPLLHVIIKKIIFKETAKINGVKRTAFSYYNRITEVCEQYDIEKKTENAYKISGILGKPFSIPYVISLIESAHQPDIYCSDRMEMLSERWVE